MIQLAVTLLAFAATDESDVEMRAAGLAFTPPPNVERTRPESPFLYSFIRRQLATEVASGRVFLVPIEPQSAIADAVERAQGVLALSFDPSFADFVLPRPEKDDEFVCDGQIQREGWHRVFAVRKVGDRFVGLLFDSVATGIDPVAPEVIESFRGMSRSDAPYPSGSVILGFGEDLALRGTVPYGFEPKASDETSGSGLAEFTPAWHLGVSAGIELRGLGDDLELSIEDAAKRWRDTRLQGRPSAVLDRFAAEAPPKGFVGAFRLGFAEGNRAFEVVLFETARRRFSLSLECEATRRESLRAAFDTMLANLREDRTLEKRRFGVRMTDAASGFSFTPPDRFRIDRGAEGLVSYVDVARRPPTARVTVRLAESGTPRPTDQETLRDRARTRFAAVAKLLSDDGWEPESTPVPNVVSGVLGAAYSFHRVTENGRVIDRRTLLCGDGRSFEISIVAAESEFEERRDLFAGIVTSFRVVPRVMPTVLGSPITSQDGRISLEPPDEWRVVDGHESVRPGALLVVPADGLPDFQIATGIDDTPPEAALAGPAERYRDRIERALTAEGANHARVVDAQALLANSPAPAVTQRSPYFFRVEYERGGVAMTELRYVIFAEEGVLYAAARLPASQYPSWRELLERSLRTLRFASNP